MKITTSKWPSSPPSNIVVRMPNWIGDAVMATPILTDLRQRWPSVHITALCQNPIGQLLLNNPDINEIDTFKRPTGWIHRIHRSDITHNLYQGKYDLGILLTNSFSSAYWFFRGSVKNRLGFSNGIRNFLLNKVVSYPKNKENQHLVETYKTVLEPLGIPLSSTKPQLYLSSEESTAAHRLLHSIGMTSSKHFVVGINPGAAYGSAKCWPPERFREVTLKLLENTSIFILYFGDASTSSLVNDICKNMPNRVINLAGKTTLRELIALINCCKIFLTNDSGPMHIAAALGVKLLALFGSTNAIKTGPYLNGQVIHKHVACSPCYKRVCPIDFRCMLQIQVDEVYEELKRLIRANHEL